MKNRVWVLGTGAASVIMVLLMRMQARTLFYITQREWQTTLTSWWMLHGHPDPWKAWTPLMGPPWQIPMEFPLFQWLTARLNSSVLSLEDTARCLSLLCFLLSALVLRRLVLDLDLKERVASSATCLYLSSPLALAYSFSATIESLALLLSLLSLWASVRWLRKPSLTSISAASLCGLAAALAKSTTWAVFAAAMAGLLLWTLFSAGRHNRSRADLVIAGLLILGIPLAGGVSWVHYSDSIKALNPLSTALSSARLSSWNFGAPELRLSISGWSGYLLRSCLLILGPLGLLLIPAAVIRWMRRPQLRPPLPVTLASITALGVGPLIFTNLYFRHDYYALTAAIFAILLLTQLLFFLKDRPILLLSLLLSNFITSGAFIALKQANYRDPLRESLVQTISSLPQEESIIVFGSYLDADIPYESGRKALQTRISNFDNPKLQQVLQRMHDTQVGAVLCRSEKFSGIARKTAEEFGLSAGSELSPGVWVWVSPSHYPLSNFKSVDLMAIAEEALRGFDPPARGRYFVLFPSGPDPSVGLGIKARGNLYLFDFRRGLRIIHHRWAPEKFFAQYHSPSFSSTE